MSDISKIKSSRIIDGFQPGDICYSLRNEKEGWILCDGRTVSRTDYSDLFEAIGTQYGEGDGTTTFNVPNYKGRFLQMVNDGQNIGDNIAAGLPNITGTITNHGTVNNNSSFGLHYTFEDNSAIYADTLVSNGFTHANGYANNLQNIKIDASRSSSIYGNSETVQPPSSLVNYFIKY